MTTKGDVLVVDDDRDIRDSLKIVLENSGYAIRTAGNSREALAAIKNKLPDIMILDIMMSSDTEGFDLAFELQQTPEFENLPIIIMTSFLDKVKEEGPDQFQHIMGESWPAKWLFEKPADPEKLIKKIEEILGSR
ncbi:MAG: response regulator [Deltaproteobacteria bacterium]|nr:response regulator [Deltaproteobacteria bacterium]